MLCRDGRAVYDWAMARLDGVLRRMRALARSLPPRDGVARFNEVYLRTTERISATLEAGEFERPDVLAHLDESFAELYFRAVEAWPKDPARVPKAWQALLEARDRDGIAPLQFVLAGMNAHINRDLAHALVETWTALELHPERGGPEHRDYLLVNSVLEQALRDVKPQLSVGVVQRVDEALGQLDDTLALFSVTHARGNAWAQAEVLVALAAVNSGAATSLAEATDRFVGFAGRALLRAHLPSP